MKWARNWWTLFADSSSTAKDFFSTYRRNGRPPGVHGCRNTLRGIRHRARRIWTWSRRLGISSKVRESNPHESMWRNFALPAARTYFSPIEGMERGPGG